MDDVDDAELMRYGNGYGLYCEPADRPLCPSSSVVNPEETDCPLEKCMLLGFDDDDDGRDDAVDDGRDDGCDGGILPLLPDVEIDAVLATVR